VTRSHSQRSRTRSLFSSYSGSCDCKEFCGPFEKLIAVLIQPLRIRRIDPGFFASSCGDACGVRRVPKLTHKGPRTNLRRGGCRKCAFLMRSSFCPDRAYRPAVPWIKRGNHDGSITDVDWDTTGQILMAFIRSMWIASGSATSQPERQVARILHSVRFLAT